MELGSPVLESDPHVAPAIELISRYHQPPNGPMPIPTS